MLKKMVVVVPTRNRADLAINAICSVLECEFPNVLVMVSDNSTSDEQRQCLAAFVGSTSDSRLSLHRPPASMTMTHHWNWVLEHASTIPNVSHVVILTDRMMFKHGALTALANIVTEYSDQIVAYNHDRVVDHLQPLRAELQPWSNEVLRVPSERLLQLSSESIFPQALPRLLNCAVPVELLDEIKRRCGDMVASISPDHSFCYRALALVPEIIYWDRAPIIHYALERSNGASAARGVSTPDHADFLASISGPLFAASPIPGLMSIGNSILHEYVVARDELSSQKFPPIDLHAYSAAIAAELSRMENTDLASRMSQLLEAFKSTHPNITIPPTAPRTNPWNPRSLARKLGVGAMLLRSYQRVRASLFRPKEIPTFDSADEAIDYARHNDGERFKSARRFAYLTR